jgi:hypothetical protein
MKKLLKTLFGYQHSYANQFNSHKFIWGEINLWSKDLSCHWRGPVYCFEPTLIVGLYFITFYIYTPAFGVETAQSCNKHRNYGFYVYSNLHNWSSIVFQFGTKSVTIDMPWTYKWHATEKLDWDMNVVLVKQQHNDVLYDRALHDFKRDYARVFDFNYKLRSGEVQHRKASVTIERSVWRCRGWPWKKKSTVHLDVNFDKEVGEGIGTWEGGTIGVTHNVLPNETPEEAFRRLEQERF